MGIVLPFIKDNTVRVVLQRALQEYGVQGQPSRKRLLVPPRNKEWRTVYSLSYDIVTGMGSTLETGEIMSPSFIVDTWRIWEWLITVGIRAGLGDRYIVKPQAATPWGEKTIGTTHSKVNVFPDVAVFRQNDRTTPIMLVDAKYKLLSENSNLDIERSDLYEAFAFCNATGCNTILLAYPSIASNAEEVGKTVAITKYQIRNAQIIAVKVAFGSVSQQGDLTSFCRKMASEMFALTQLG